MLYDVISNTSHQELLMKFKYGEGVFFGFASFVGFVNFVSCVKFVNFVSFVGFLV